MKTDQRGTILPVVLIVLAVVLAGAIGAILVVRNPSSNANNVQCTLEAKLCPDGSSVGRVPPSCAFAACPLVNVNASNTNASQSLTTPDGTISLVCAQDEDCRLINPSESYAACCSGSTCLEVDATYAAVNAASFNETVRAARAAKDCSKYMCLQTEFVAPPCSDGRFAAKCVSGLCQMVARP